MIRSGMTSCGKDWHVEVSQGGLGWVRRCVLGFDGLGFGQGTAVKAGFVQTGCDEVRLGLAVGVILGEA